MSKVKAAKEAVEAAAKAAKAKLGKTEAQKVLSRINTAEQAVALRGPERQQYLGALDTALDPRFKDPSLLMSAAGKKPTAADALSKLNRPFGQVLDKAGDALEAYDEHVASPLGAAAADAATDLANLTRIPGTSAATHDKVLQDVGAAAELGGEIGLDPTNYLPGAGVLAKMSKSQKAVGLLEKLRSLRSLNLEKPLAATMIKATPASSTAKALAPLKAADEAVLAAKRPARVSNQSIGSGEILGGDNFNKYEEAAKAKVKAGSGVIIKD